MQRIKGFDALMYYSENPTAYQHVLGLLLLDPGTCPGGVLDRESLESLLLSRFDQAGLFRKKFVKAPMDLAFPALVDDPGFRLQNHVTHIALPSPGSYEQLADIVSGIASKPLDMKRPLWEMTLIDGFEGGRYSVLVTKTHHCLMDGVGGAAMMSTLLDKEPIAPPPLSSLERAWVPESPTVLERRWSDLQDIRDTYTGMISALGGVGRHLAGKAVHAVGTKLGITPAGETGDQVTDEDSVLRREMPNPVPRLYFNRALSASRSVAFGKFSAGGVKEIRQVLGLTFNDVLLGICTLALRRFLADHDALPDGNIVATMPISTRGEETSEGLNQLRIVQTPLPLQAEDAVTTLQRTGAILDEIKALHASRGTGGIKFSKLITPRLGVVVSHLYGVEGLADHVRFLKSNAAISTIPGPPMQLYLGGAKLVSICPAGPLADGIGMTISLMTYRDAVNFTVTVCPDHVPDVQLLADYIDDAFATSLAAVRKVARSKPGVSPGKARRKTAVAKKAAKRGKVSPEAARGRRKAH